jgi:hypothetical protein
MLAIDLKSFPQPLRLLSEHLRAKWAPDLYLVIHLSAHQNWNSLDSIVAKRRAHEFFYSARQKID